MGRTLCGVFAAGALALGAASACSDDTGTNSGSTARAGTAGTSGTGGANAGAAGEGAGGASGVSDSTACQTRDDCVIANVFSNTGCCTRTDCGVALNRDWVQKEPCASADPATDAVPDSCSKGCQLCPASHCEQPVGVLCTAGKCQTVSEFGPCETEKDCDLAIDYTTQFGACCHCYQVVSKAYNDAEECIVQVGSPKPAGCELPNGQTCDGYRCPVDCPMAAFGCSMGRCLP